MPGRLRLRPQPSTHSGSAATGGRGEAGHLAEDPRCPAGYHRDGATIDRQQFVERALVPWFGVAENERKTHAWSIA